MNEPFEVLRLRDGLSHAGVAYSVTPDGSTEWLSSGLCFRASLTDDRLLGVSIVDHVSADDLLTALGLHARRG